MVWVLEQGDAGWVLGLALSLTDLNTEYILDSSGHKAGEGPG